MEQQFSCSACNKKFISKYSLPRHIKRCKVIKCDRQSELNLTNNTFDETTKNISDINELQEEEDELNLIQIELNKAMRIIDKQRDLIKNKDELIDDKDELLEEKENTIEKQIEDIKEAKKNIKLYKNQLEEMNEFTNEQKDLIRSYEKDIFGLKLKIEHKEEICQIYEKQIIELREYIKGTNKYNENIIMSISNNATKSSNLGHTNHANQSHNNTNNSNNVNNKITMILQNYTPSAIESIDKLINIKETLSKYINLFESWSKEKIMHKKLGDIIINNYQDSDPTKQKLWCTDVSRLVYYIRTVENIENNNNVEQSRIKEIWENDKGGLKVSAYIITPLLNCLDELLKTWLFDNTKNKENGVNIINKMGLIADMLEIISTGELNKMILQYISNYFSVNKKTGEIVTIKP